MQHEDICPGALKCRQNCRKSLFFFLKRHGQMKSIVFGLRRFFKPSWHVINELVHVAWKSRWIIVTVVAPTQPRTTSIYCYVQSHVI